MAEKKVTRKKPTLKELKEQRAALDAKIEQAEIDTVLKEAIEKNGVIEAIELVKKSASKAPPVTILKAIGQAMKIPRLVVEQTPVKPRGKSKQ